MKVSISIRANDDYKRICGYILEHFGIASKRDFSTSFRDNVYRLKKSPYIGKIEPILEEKSSTYRSIVITSVNKLVYRIADNAIQIVAIWDVRRSPENLAKSIEENNQ